MSEPQVHLTIIESEGVSTVEFADRKILDELSIREIEDEIFTHINEQNNIKLLLCFKNVEHLSSAALGMLINLNKVVSGQSGQLRLSDISPQIYEVFKITRLNKLFEIHETTGKALNSFT